MWEEVERSWEGKTIIRIYCTKKIYFQLLKNPSLVFSEKPEKSDRFSLLCKYFNSIL